ncbi:MAG TPA: hypothetical protein VFZ66_15350 [Herpetosiphonaceae bacterium]
MDAAAREVLRIARLVQADKEAQRHQAAASCAISGAAWRAALMCGAIVIVVLLDRPTRFVAPAVVAL